MGNDISDITATITSSANATPAYASALPDEKPYDAKSHRALENDPKFAKDDIASAPLGMGRRDDTDTDWGPLGVSTGGFGYSAGKK